MEPTNVVYDICRNFVADYASTVDSALIRKVSGWHRARSIMHLADASSLYCSAMHSSTDLKFLLQIEALFKKCAHFSSEECDKNAMISFRESEEICAETNRRLDGHYAEADVLVSSTVSRMADIIRHTLGPLRPFLEELPSLVRATSGATATQPRSSSGGAERLKRSMYATERSHIYLKSLAKFWGYNINLRKIHHNRVELVPKNWKTSRTIACEPEGNVFLQLAFDTYCKRLLRRRLKIDLSDQSRNQRLALQSSVDGSLCTVDLKAASDRLSLNCVHLLFDEEWARFFLDTRSPCWKDEGGILHPYHKLSSMGNGYTFTIETLVFAAACKAVGSKTYSVYGDDIIIETELFDKLVAILAYLGFEINSRKSHYDRPQEVNPAAVTTTQGGFVPLFSGMSYEPVEDGRATRDGFNIRLAYARPLPSRTPVSGVYRESCGVHAFGGHIITPFFIRSLRTRRDWVLLANNIAAFAPIGGSVWEYGQEIVRALNLPLGPPNLDACSCVFIDVPTCYKLGLIRVRKKGDAAWQPKFRALVPKARVQKIVDSRALFLWFLTRKNAPYESSRYSLGTDKYRSKWVCFNPYGVEHVGGSVRLHWWTETILAVTGR